jgi:Na+-driven multidrug efflux pump
MSVTALSAAAGAVSVAAIAGYGIASRLEMLLSPVMFGCGTAAITLVGTNLGAGNVARARRVAIAYCLLPVWLDWLDCSCRSSRNSGWVCLPAIAP